MTEILIFNKILKNSTITIDNVSVIIDKYKKEYLDITNYTDFIYFLCHLQIIDKDSGNWETGEKHYTLNHYFIDIINLKVYVKDITKHLKNKYPNAKYKKYTTDDIENIINILSRKEKIRKINATCDI